MRPPARPAAAAPAASAPEGARRAAEATACPALTGDAVDSRRGLRSRAAIASVQDLADALGLIAGALEVLGHVLRRLGELLARLADGLRDGLGVQPREALAQRAGNRHAENGPAARAAPQRQTSGDSGHGRADRDGRPLAVVATCLIVPVTPDELRLPLLDAVFARLELLRLAALDGARFFGARFVAAVEPAEPLRALDERDALPLFRAAADLPPRPWPSCSTACGYCLSWYRPCLLQLSFPKASRCWSYPHAAGEMRCGPLQVVSQPKRLGARSCGSHSSENRAEGAEMKYL